MRNKRPSVFRTQNKPGPPARASTIESLLDIIREKTKSIGHTDEESQANEALIQHVMRRRTAPDLQRELPLYRIWPVFAIASFCGTLLTLLFLWSPSALGFSRADGVPVGVGGAIIPAEGQPALLNFSDGSSIRFEAQAQGHIAEITSHGARIVLEKGTADVQIAHLPGANWVIEAGPFEVRVTGTAFAIAWSEKEKVLNIQMNTGTVEVTGPLFLDAPLPLRTGQHLRASIGEQTAQVRDRSATTKAESSALPKIEPGQTALNPEEPLRQPLTGSTTPSALPTLPELSWTHRVHKGDYAGVLEDALEGGIENTLNHATEEDLTALGTAAGYGRRQDIAARAWQSIRTRFPHGKQACRATFLLGRAASDSEHNSNKTIALYDELLRDCPKSSFVMEALGRKMLALEKASGPNGARSVAEEYLRLFPKGPFAGSARRLVEQKTP